MISNRFCSSNSDSCSAPGLDEGLDLRGAQRADPIQVGRAQLVADAGAGEHAPVPDQTTRVSPNRFLSLVIWAARVFGSAVLPSNTSMATGTPAVVHSSP